MTGAAPEPQPDSPRYLRCTWSAPAAEGAPRAAAVLGAAPASAPPDPDDDWSGAAAYLPSPDPEALEYAHPEAVALIRGLEPAGWQQEEAGDTLVFWLPEAAATGTAATDALRRLGELGTLDVRPESPGWEDEWKRFHEPHAVGRLYLRPPWSAPRPELLDVVVEAGRAFGTGGHASTRLCLAELQTIAPGSLLDLGCGSGVVALAALRLGFAPVWGVDFDPVAVREAGENAERNGLAPAFSVGDATDPGTSLPAAATVVANLALRPILGTAWRWAPGAAAAPAAPADLLLAGLLIEQGDEAAAAFPGFAEVARREEGEWLMLHLRRR